MFNRPSPFYSASFFAKCAEVTYTDTPETDEHPNAVTRCEIRFNRASRIQPEIVIFLPYGGRLQDVSP